MANRACRTTAEAYAPLTDGRAFPAGESANRAIGTERPGFAKCAKMAGFSRKNPRFCEFDFTGSYSKFSCETETRWGQGSSARGRMGATSGVLGDSHSYFVLWVRPELTCIGCPVDSHFVDLAGGGHGAGRVAGRRRDRLVASRKRRQPPTARNRITKSNGHATPWLGCMNWPAASPPTWANIRRASKKSATN